MVEGGLLWIEGDLEAFIWSSPWSIFLLLLLKLLGSLVESLDGLFERLFGLLSL